MYTTKKCNYKYKKSSDKRKISRIYESMETFSEESTLSNSIWVLMIQTPEYEIFSEDLENFHLNSLQQFILKNRLKEQFVKEPYE